MQRSERSDTGTPYRLADFVDGVGFFCGYIAPTQFPEHTHPEVAVDVCYENTSCLSTWQTAGGRQLTRLLGEGNVSILPGGQPHASEWRQGAEHVIFYLTPDFVERAARDLLREAPLEIVEDRTADDPMIRQLVGSLRAELRRGHKPERLYVESLANVLAAHLLRSYSARPKPLLEPGEGLSRRRLGKEDGLRRRGEKLARSARTGSISARREAFARPEPAGMRAKTRSRSDYERPTQQDPTTKYPQPQFSEQQQRPPGTTGQMDPRPDHGEETYKGSGRLAGKKTIITGADSGIGKAVAIAFAREGADVLISYLDEEEDAQDTKKWVEEAGRKAVLVPGNVADPAHCRAIVQKAVEEFGQVDVLVNNAAFQMTRNSLEEIPDEEWDHTLATNISAFFHLAKAAVPHMQPGSSIIGSSSVNSDTPPPTLLPYNVTKAGIANMVATLAQMYGPRGIRANSVAPGPIWTPLIPATMPPEQASQFGMQVPLGRPGQPAELAPVYVMLASDEASYVSGARVAVTGGQPIL